MVDQQKQKASPPRLIVACLVLVFGISISTIFAATLNTSSASAVGNCPGTEIQGTGQGNTPDTNKCYTVSPTGATATNNVPTGAAATNSDPAPTSDIYASDSTEEDDVTCAIEKMGWILCPLIETSGKMGDKAFNLLAGNFLQTEPELLSSAQGSGTKIAWELARNIANLMFIAVFLVVILSQVTGQGINNYGIKKLLPRLIIGAVAVNVSFYICQLMVDLSNILGFELKNFLVDISKTVTDRAVFPPSSGVFSNQTSEGALGIMAAGILGLTIVWLLLPVLVMGVGTVLITCLVIIIILLLRKAIIILLVVASPIAFVMYLLPNTEKIFSKWLRMFWGLLMVFPVVAVLFGGGQLASSIIIAAGTTKADKTYSDGSEKCIQLPTWSDNTASSPEQAAKIADCQTGSTPFMLGLIAAGIAVAPMLAVWSVLKGALNAAGAIGGKIAGAVQSAGNKGSKLTSMGEDKLKKRMGENMNRRWQNAQAGGLAGEGGAFNRFAGGVARRRARRGERMALSKADLERQQRAELDRQLTGEGAGELTAGLSSAGAQRAIRGAQAAEQKLLSEEVQAERIAADAMAVDAAALEAVASINDGDTNSARTAAVIERAMKAGSAEQKAAIVDALQGKGPSLASRTTAASIAADNPGYFGAGAIDDISRGTNTSTYRDLAQAGIADGRFTAEKMASANRSDTEYALQVSVGHTGAMQNLAREAQKALTGESTKGKIGAQRSVIETMLP